MFSIKLPHFEYVLFGAFLLLGSFILGLPTFFYYPRKFKHKITSIIPWAAIWVNATALTLMGITGLMILMNYKSVDPYADNVSTGEMLFASLSRHQ